MSPRDWDAHAYDRAAAGVKTLGHEVLARLDLRGDELVPISSAFRRRCTTASSRRSSTD